MPSLLAWLDHSEEDQRRMRELVAMFTQEESRDELGIGAIRDAFSNQLFPGTSVIQTRARYFLFVPWIFRQGGGRGLSGSALRDWGEKRERWLIPALKRGGDESGLIGRVAGPGVKILPSTIYWSGLQTFGIARHSGSLDQALRAPGRLASDEADELTDRTASIWHPTLPAPPPGFFSFEAATFDLSFEEASWLAERIEERAAESILGYLLVHRLEPQAGSSAPWDDPAMIHLPGVLQAVVEHGRLFSLAIRGAALLYNLLLARRARDLGFDTGDLSISYEEELDEWWREVSTDPAVARWDRTAFWEVVGGSQAQIATSTVRWVNAWLDRVADGTAAMAKSDGGLATLIADRERRLKGAKSRLVNERLLANWRGESGVGRLVYRWGIARTHLADIFAGLTDAST
jgi:hypothetical protein